MQFPIHHLSEIPSNTKSILCIVILVCFFSFGLPGQDYSILFSTDENYILSPISPADDNLVLYGASVFSLSGLLPPGTLSQETNVDALGKMSANEIVFSLEEDASLPDALLVADEDLILFNGYKFGLWWDGSAAGLPPEVNLDAVHILSTSRIRFLFSLEEDAVLPSVGLVADEDILQYEDLTGFSMVVDGSAAGIPVEADLDALCRDPFTTDYVLSLDSAVWINGIFFDDADLLEFTGAKFVLYFDASVAGMPEETDLDAVEILEVTHINGWMFL